MGESSSISLDTLRSLGIGAKSIRSELRQTTRSDAKRVCTIHLADRQAPAAVMCSVLINPFSGDLLPGRILSRRRGRVLDYFLPSVCSLFLDKVASDATELPRDSRQRFGLVRPPRNLTNAWQLTHFGSIVLEARSLIAPKMRV